MIRWVLCLVVLSCAACTPARRQAEGNLVRQVHFEGNGGLLSGHNDYQLRTQMKQRYSGFGVLTWPLLYVVEPSVLQAELLPQDAYRLEVWYAHHGWFDARVKGWELRKIREPRPHRAGVLDIRGVVDPGQPSTVRTLQISGGSKVLEAVWRAVARSAPIREDDLFDLQLAQATRDLLLDKLRNQARAYATAELQVTAFPEDHEVDVTVIASAGPACRIGPVTIDGNVSVPTELLRQRLGLIEGDGYKLSDLRVAQRQLFEMGTFAIATVEPDLSDPTVTDVPIRVSVREAKFRTLRIGGGASYDGFLFEPRVSSRLRHVNLFDSLVRAELGVRAGLAYDLTGTELQTRLPNYGVDVAFEYPRIAQQRVAMLLAAEFEKDIYSGLWAYRRPQADLSLVWRVNPKVRLQVGPHAEQYTFLTNFGTEPQGVQNAQRRLFGIDAGDDFTYQLTALDQVLTFDFRDDRDRTTRGGYRQFSLREAIPLTDAGYFFVRGSADYRQWFPLRTRNAGNLPLVVAFRGRGTILMPLGDKSIPVPERAYLGGANSLRGFRQNQVGPYTTLCTTEPYESNGAFFGFLGNGETETLEQVQLFHLPEGGNLAVETSLELRYDWIYGITVATFVDAGMLSPVLWDPQGWVDGIRASAGAGLRYDTLVGPLRFDLSFRPQYPEDDGPERYEGNQCDPADEEPRIHDFFANFAGLRGDNHPPLSMVFFLTIGEAF